MKKRKSLPLYIQIILALVLGILFGILGIFFDWSVFISDWIAPAGEVFLRLLKLVALPLVFISLIHGI